MTKEEILDQMNRSIVSKCPWRVPLPERYDVEEVYPGWATGSRLESQLRSRAGAVYHID